MKKAISLLLVLIMVFALCACDSGSIVSENKSPVGTSGSSSPEGDSGTPETAPVNTLGQMEEVEALFDEDGAAYLFWEGGGKAVITEKTKDAYISPDRQTIVALYDGGLLCTYNSSLNNKLVIADNASFFLNFLNCVRNDGFFYADKDAAVYRVRFFDGEKTKVAGTDSGTESYTVAEDTTSVLYATDDGAVYAMPYNTSQPIQVGRWEKDVTCAWVSNDAMICIWEYTNAEGQRCRVISNDSDCTILKDSGSNPGRVIDCSKDQNMVVSAFGDTLSITRKGLAPVQVQLNNLAISDVYSGSGLLSDTETSEVSTIYTQVATDDGYNVYAITPHGKKERILTRVQSWTVHNNIIVYYSKDNELCYAPLDGTTIGNEWRIVGGVDSYRFTDDGKYVFYARNSNESHGALYAYKIGDESPVKIASDVSRTKFGYLFSYSTDGKTIYYYTDVEEINPVAPFGTLNKWTYGKSGTASEKIASDVITFSLTSYLEKNFIHNNVYTYRKFNYCDSEDRVHLDLMLYDGSGSMMLQSNLMPYGQG